MTKVTKPYDRQSHDTDKSWAAFCIYRDMGSDRTIEKLRIEIGQRSVRHLEKWSSENNWGERCRAFDADELARQSIALQKQRIKNRVLAAEHQNRLVERVKQMLEQPLRENWRESDIGRNLLVSCQLGDYATGGEVKKLDEIEALTVLVDCGWLPETTLVKFSEQLGKLKAEMLKCFESIVTAS
jgi:hypothetical protein